MRPAPVSSGSGFLLFFRSGGIFRQWCDLWFPRAKQWFAGESVGHQFALVDQNSSTDDHKLHPCAGFHRRLVSGAVGDGLPIKNDDIGVSPLLQASLQASRGGGFLQALSWHQAHLANGVHECEASFFADIVGEDAGERKRP